MSFDALTREVAAWPDDQVRRFQAFLVTLRHQREQGTLEKLAAKLDTPIPHAGSVGRMWRSDWASPRHDLPMRQQ